MAQHFQFRVWSLLRKIPRGRVTTYADLARALGSPRAARAVAQACARNPHPIVTPCHRVVMSDGSIGGYSGPGGERRKAALLTAEGIRIQNKHIVGFKNVRKNF
jgi:methylated-DNA-[protein]-cysteine S-methyltransferase